MLKKGRFLLSSLALSALASLSACERKEFNLNFKGTTEKVEYNVGDWVSFADSEVHLVSTSSFLTEESKELKLKSRTIVEDGMEFPSGRYVLLQFDHNLNAEDKMELEGKGVHILEPVTSKTYVAALDALPESLDTSGKKVKKVVNFTPEDKIDKLIAEKNYTWGRDKGLTHYAVTFFSDVPSSIAKGILEHEGASVENNLLLNTFQVNVPASLEDFVVGELAKRDEVKYISPVPIPLTHTNFNSRGLAATDALTLPPLSLSGEGMTIGVYDGGFVSDKEEDLEDRVIVAEELNSGIVFSPPHSTHVACTAAGDGTRSAEAIKHICSLEGRRECDANGICHLRITIPAGFLNVCYAVMDDEGNMDSELMDRLFKGVATKATIVSDFHDDCDPVCLWNDPNTLPEKYLNMVLGYDAKVINNSIGSNASANGYPCEINGSHDLTSWIVNYFVAGGFWGKPVTVVYAAGNERGELRCLADEFGFDTIGAPAAGAKNAIIVGATGLTAEGLTSAFYSSYGPTDDGRIGITVTANGGSREFPVISCTFFDFYEGMKGTSMATPLVTGTVALIYEYGDLYGVEIVPSLVKAIIANSASDLGAPGPDFIYGFGDMLESGPRIRDTLNSGRFKKRDVRDGETHTYFLMKTKEGGKVTLAYTDALESLYAAKLLVNDLDVEIVSPSGIRHLPLVPDASFPGKPATVKRDDVNNIEQVVIGSSDREIVKVHVKGYDVVSGLQEYSLASSYDFFKAEPAVVENHGREFKGSLKVDAYKLECTTTCNYNYIETPMNDLKTDTTRIFEKEFHLKDVFPGFVPKEPGYYRLSVTVYDDAGEVVTSSSEEFFTYDFYVK